MLNNVKYIYILLKIVFSNIYINNRDLDVSAYLSRVVLMMHPSDVLEFTEEDKKKDDEATDNTADSTCL